MLLNFFESFGQLVFKKISLPIFLLILSIGPLCTAFYLYTEKNETEIFQEQFTSIMKKANPAFQKKQKIDQFLKIHNHSDPYFIDKEIESICFLTKEITDLKDWISHPAISNKDLLTKRLSLLQSARNRLSFNEEDTRVSKSYKETIEKQKESIQIDVTDLKNLLGLIEETPVSSASIRPARPQLIITDFFLQKSTTSLQNEVFELQMELLKREFKSQ